MKPAPSTLSLLIFAAATHFLVDTVAGMLNPLWPRLDAHYALAGWQSAGVFFIWQLSTSLSQFWFGLYGDRFHARWLLWAGPLAAVVCLGCIGLTHSPSLLAALLTVAGLGVAAYHPEAAALAGNCGPEHRSRAISIFMMGGFLGQAAGPITSGSLVDALGLGGMTWSLVAGLVAAGLMVPLARGVLSQPPPARRRPARLSEMLEGQSGVIGLVMLIGSLRIVAAGGIPVLTGYLLQERGASGGQTGLVQSAFMLGIGLGGLACAVVVRRHQERLILWLCPLVVAPVVAAIPWASGWVLLAASGLSGLLLGISLPVLISFGQQLMPHSQRIASSLTMGVSWGVGGGVVSLILAISKYAGDFQPAFVVFAIASAVSSVLCFWLPPAFESAGEQFSMAETSAAT
jgi:MFS transporter, FSR family, fosmidomycin resistance protein